MDYWFEARGQDASERLTDRVQLALAESSVFLRVCSPAAAGSFWMGMEQGAFLSLQADDQRTGRAGQRTLVNLIIAAGYQRQPFDYASPLIDAAHQPPAEWVNALRAALDLAPLAPRDVPPIRFNGGQESAPAAGRKVSRRAVLAAGAGALALGAAGAAGVLIAGRRGPGGPGGSPTSTPSLTVSDTPRWKSPVGGKIAASATVADGMVYIGDLNSVLYAFSTKDGKLQWKYPASGAPTGKGIYVAPAVADRVVYSYGNDDYITALDALTGAVRWTTAPPTGLGTATIGFAAPVLADGVLYVASYTSSPSTAPGVLKGLDPTTGAELPGSALNVYISATPRFVNGVLYVASQGVLDSAGLNLALDGYLYALDPKSGLTELWDAHVGQVSFSSPAISGGVAYVCTSAPDPSEGAPAAPDNPATDRGYLQAVDLATHAIRWRFGAGKTIYSSPLAANGLVYFGADDHTVYAVDAGTGRRRWSYTPAASS